MQQGARLAKSQTTGPSSQSLESLIEHFSRAFDKELRTAGVALKAKDTSAFTAAAKQFQNTRVMELILAKVKSSPGEFFSLHRRVRGSNPGGGSALTRESSMLLVVAVAVAVVAVLYYVAVLKTGLPAMLDIGKKSPFDE
jgi:hypothetical protein